MLRNSNAPLDTEMIELADSFRVTAATREWLREVSLTNRQDFAMAFRNQQELEDEMKAAGLLAGTDKLIERSTAFFSLFYPSVHTAPFCMTSLECRVGTHLSGDK